MLRRLLAEVSRRSDKLTMEIHAAKLCYEEAQKEDKLFRKRLVELATKSAIDEGSREALHFGTTLSASALKMDLHASMNRRPLPFPFPGQWQPSRSDQANQRAPLLLE